MKSSLNKHTVSSVLVLSLLALLGNYAAYPLFYSVAFIFGSISVIYAALSLGRFAAVFVAFVGGLYTFHLWGHPYAIIIFMAEAFWVATLIKRCTFHAVLIDVAYWLLLGIPLVFLFYTQFIGLPINAAALIGLKQSLNGIFNALIASFILIAINALTHKKQNISIQPLLFNIFLLITLVAGTVPAVINTHQTSANFEIQINEELKNHATQIHHALLTHSKQKKVQFDHLPYAEDISIVILNKQEALHQHGEIKSLKPVKNSELITSKNNISIWLPDFNLASMKRWQLGRYVFTQNISNVPGITKIIVEKSAAGVVNKVNDLKIDLFLILTVLMIIAILCAYILSRWITQPINNLDKISREMNHNIKSGKIDTLPQSSISEFSNLTKALQKMAIEASENYQDLHQEKDHLVAIVDKNTETLKRISMVASRTTNSVIITDIAGKTEWINDAFIKLTGYELTEIINKKPGDFLQGEDTDEKTIARISSRLKKNQGFAEDIVNYAKDGTPYWVHIDCDPIFNDDELIGFISIESDITQRKKTEDNLLKKTAELNAVLNAATEISVITTDTDGLITMFNSGAEKMLGYSAEELVGKETPALLHLESEVILRGHELSKELKQEINGFNVFIAIPNIEGSETREWTYIKKDGSHISVNLSVTTITSENGETTGYLGVAQDITERKRLESMKREFVSTVSHELRTPLTSINGTLGLINGGAVGELPEQAKSMLTVALENTQRLTLLINDLLDMEKIANGKMSFDLQLIEILPLVEKAINMNSAYAEQYNVKFNLESQCDQAKANVDPNRFLQIMANFLSNAAKFSHTNSNVDISIQCLNDHVKIAIRDYGVGIEDHFYEKIFNKFSQADSSDTRDKGGTGLGLAITKELAKYMHGEVGFESEQGKGSTFWLELPLAK